MNDLVITGATITPVAFHDPPLLNQIGVHEPFALRAIVEIATDAGIIGLGETYGDAFHVERLHRAAAAIQGCDVFALSRMRTRIAVALNQDATADKHGLTGAVTSSGAVDRVWSPFEVACLDAQGHAIGRPVHDLLGGAVRTEVPYSAYLFWKWGGHPGEDDDEWGETLDASSMVEQARRMIDEYGFTAIKVKGGVLPPDDEIAAIQALRDAFPSHPLRLDPNGGWTVETSLRVARELDGVLEYLEDPVLGIRGMAEVARSAPMPLATNMCVVDFEHVPEAFEKRAVGIVLSDHHYWGGLTRSKLLAGICGTYGIGLSMHSNSHLGISLAAMTHLGAAVPELPYACDTHWPWKRSDEDIVVKGTLAFAGGAIAVPDGPGLGIELDRDALAKLHEQYLRCGLTQRNDTEYMRRVDPTFERVTPRW